MDRVGMAVLSLLGVFLGLLISSTSDISVTPTLLIMFPGLVIGVPALVWLSEPLQEW